MFPDISCDDIFRLETPRLWLRWLRAADAAAVAAIASLEAVAQMTASIPHPYPPGEAERFILAARAATASGNALVVAVTLKNKARTVIGFGSAQATESREVEIGYVVAPSHAGQGYATEATRALVDAVFNLTEARLVVATSRSVNPASRRVLEKCGFTFRETRPVYLPARGAQHPCDVFTVDRHAWCRSSREKSLPAMAEQASRGSSLPDGGAREQ